MSYLQRVNELLTTHQSYEDVRRFLYKLGESAKRYFMNGDSSSFVDRIEFISAKISKYSLRRLHAIIKSLPSFPMKELEGFPQELIDTDLSDMIRLLVARDLPFDEKTLIEKVITPLTALRRLTFIYGMLKLIDRIQGLPDSIHNVDIKIKSVSQCMAYLKHAEEHRDTLIDIIKKLMLFHSEYMEPEVNTTDVVTKPVEEPRLVVDDQNQNVPTRHDKNVNSIGKPNNNKSSLSVNDTDENMYFIPQLRIIYGFYKNLRTQIHHLYETLEKAVPKFNNELQNIDDDDDDIEDLTKSNKLQPPRLENKIKLSLDAIKTTLKEFTFIQGKITYTILNIQQVFENIKKYKSSFGMIKQPESLMEAIEDFKHFNVQKISSVENVEDVIETINNLLRAIEGSFGETYEEGKKYFDQNLKWDVI